MRFLAFSVNGRDGLAVVGDNGEHWGLMSDDSRYPGSLSDLVVAGGGALGEAASKLLEGQVIDIEKVNVLPPFPKPNKIFCLGLNYAEHAAEGGFEPPPYPTVFARFASSLIGHNAPIICPKVSHLLDYEGEFVAVIGKGGKNIDKDSALGHVVGYAVFNDASIRDYQLITPQWTIGKNFDDTGAFGPYFVTADELPAGAAGLHIETRLNGEVVQSASTDDLIFDVATTVSLLSVPITLDAGDIIVMGTPSGVGHARKPPLYMKDGDVCEVEVEGMGILRNPIVNEA
jgi:2-keto-4-pentenoate hydratase/2-oxohepta-3-ene-1,7-dioic acid hydratase in catechol pathway